MAGTDRTGGEGGESRSGSLRTLDRGLRALSLIAQAESGLSIPDLADRIGIHRTIVYRIAATLEQHGLVARGPKGMLRLGAGIVAMSSRFLPHLREVSQPLLDALAEETGAAAFVSVPQDDQCVAIMVAEPQNTPLRVAYRIGSRHPLARGAAGLAILAGRPPKASDTGAIRQARRDGYSVTRGELQPGALGVASPLHGGGAPGFEACLGVVTLGEADADGLATAVTAAAARLRALLGGTG